ncbi:MAG: LPD38 domain-containing protein, partial [Aequorivita vladivostokensis]|nr:LPD38 domain-containing protein [Aequorivita vladivostokensis]
SITEAFANYDFFRQKNIVSPYESGRALEKRNYAQASNLGKFIGENVNIDPRKIDHIIRGQFTYYGQQGMALSDIGREDKPTDIRKLSGFYKTESPAVYRDVQWLQEQAGLYGLEKEPYYGFLKEMVYAYYNSENKEVKKNMAKEIRNFSADIKRVWKAQGILDKKAIENEFGFKVESIKQLVPEMTNAIDKTKDPVAKRKLEKALKKVTSVREKVKIFRENQ